MERFMDDSVNIRKVLPWIESDEDIINFMNMIPLDNAHLRNSLTIYYFLKLKDKNGTDFEQKIDADAQEIVNMLPEISYNVIKERLTVLGNMPNRKEVVLRQLLHGRQDLARLVKEIYNVDNKKRKSTESLFEDLDSSNETNIKIKIRKVEGTLEVVPSIKQEKSPKSLEVGPDATGSRSSPIIVGHEDDDLYPEFTWILNEESIMNKGNFIKPSRSSIPRPVHLRDLPNPKSKVCSSNKPEKIPVHVSEPSTSKENINIPGVSKTTVNEGSSNSRNISGPSTSKENGNIPRVNNTTVKEGSNNSRNIYGHEDFDLIEYLKMVTGASAKIIISVCKKFNVSNFRKPDDATLNDLLNNILEVDVIDINASESNSSHSSDTEEYFYASPNGTINVDNFGKTENVPAQKLNVPQLNPTAKEFKLREPVLIIPSSSATKKEDSKIRVVSPKRQVVRPPRFIPDTVCMPREPNVIPALPNQFMFGTEQIIEPGNAMSTNIPAIAKMDLASINSENRVAQLEETSLPAVDFQEPGTSNAPVSRKRILDERLVLRLIEMFPEAAPEYIRDICDARQWSQFDDIITVILSADSYPKRPERGPSPKVEVDLEEQFEIVKALLPDADPTYLRLKCEQIGNNPEELNEFINQSRESKNYPTMKEYLRKQQLSAQSKQYTTEFKVENFVELFPNPEETFNNPKRNVKLDSYARFYISTYFQNKFNRLHKKSISRILDSNHFKILASNDAMLMAMQKKDIMKSRRKQMELPDHGQNILLLQELAYLTHKEEIDEHIRVTKEKEKEDRQNAKENGLMNTCQCCFDDEVMPNDTFYCPKNCMFCKDCIQKSCEVALGDGRTDFKCLNDCPEEFTLQTLQNVLPPRMFSKLAQKKALAEIRAAEIEELEMCPFCDFASIPNETDKIFRCLNPDCMKESCRSCKEPNHIPLKCDELEKDEHVKARTHVENKMTEALLRKCWKCGTSFFKEEGCNKMTCTCGANMCYICKKPVTDYTHFNGIGGDKYHLCPLYSDTNLINQQNVIGAAQAAKAEVDPSNLKVDPSVDIQEHYEKRKRILPREPHMEVLLHNVGRGHAGVPLHRVAAQINAPIWLQQEVLVRRHLERQRRPPQ